MQLYLIAQLGTAVQLGLGLVFLFAVVPKLRRPLAFTRTVMRYDILPRRPAYVLALTLLPLETFLAAAFLSGLLIEPALALSTAVTAMFVLAVSINLRRGRRIGCGCFGNDDETI